VPLPVSRCAGEAIAAVGLERVMPIAEPGEILDRGRAVVVDWYHVVELEVVGAITAEHYTHRIAGQDRTFECDRKSPAGPGR
jgi:hypothetical protein